MSKEEGKTVDLGASGTFTSYLSKDKKRLLLAFEVDPRGLTKTDLNVFIDTLKKVREKMVR